MIAAVGQNTLSFEEALNVALKNNVDLKTSQNNLKINKAQKKQSYFQLAPTASAFLQADRADGNFFIEQEARTVNQVSQNVFGVAEVNWNIFNGLGRHNTIKQSIYDLEAQEQFIERTEQDVIFNVAQQYLQVLLDGELLIIAEQNLDAQKVLLEQIKTFVQAGTRAPTDELTQLAQVKNEELNVLRARNALRNDKSLLAQTLQIDPLDEFEVEKPNWDIESISNIELAEDEITGMALGHRADLKQSLAQYESSKKAIGIARSNYFPTVSAFFRYSSRFTDATDRTFSEQFFTDNTRNQIGLQLAIPLFNGLQNKVTVERAKVNLENARLTQENLQKSILIEVQRAYQNFQDAIKAQEAAGAQFDATDLVLKQQNESYNVGVANLVELSQANQNHIASTTSLAQAEYTLLFQKILLDYSLGILQAQELVK